MMKTFCQSVGISLYQGSPLDIELEATGLAMNSSIN